MIFIAFGKWDSTHGRVFKRERLYLNHKWTPLCRISFRYLKTSREYTKAPFEPTEERGFEIGKYYKNDRNEMLHILGEIKTTMWRDGFVAESTVSGDVTLEAINHLPEAVIGWQEITEHEWLSFFNKLSEVTEEQWESCFDHEKEPLRDTVFLFFGFLKNISKKDAERAVRDRGGKVAGFPHGITHVVRGEVTPDTNVAKINEDPRGCKILNESEFLKLIGRTHN